MPGIKKSPLVLCVLFLLCAALMAGCDSSMALPTQSSIEMAQTAVVLTEAAPPPGFQESIAYPTLDAKLTRLPSWHGSVNITFDGVDSTLKEKTTAKLDAQIYRNELASTRRVVFSAEGAAFGVTDARLVEAVRIVNDYYWVLQNPQVCAVVNNDAARKRIADLTASAFIAGVGRGVPTGQRAKINGLDAWEYAFAPGDVVLNIIETDKIGKYTIAAGNLWVAPSVDAIVRLTLTVNVEDVRLLDADLPVIGQLRIIYELKAVGEQYNITVPFGC
jgi:hypothetical protein